MRFVVIGILLLAATGSLLAAFFLVDFPESPETRLPSKQEAEKDKPDTTGGFRVAMPVDCRVGEDCWVINYPDADPGEGHADFACGRMSYNTHKGTDFGIATIREMNEGVGVIAAVSGTVVGVRDGMRDVNMRDLPASEIKGRECGNGIYVHHEDGWDTQYCHLKKGSVAVKKGDTIRVGQKIGEIGYSGSTEFPHLHFNIFKDKKPIDPYRGLDGGPDCRLGVTPLWTPSALRKLGYLSPILVNGGFTDEVINQRKGETGDHEKKTLSRTSPVIVLWFRVFGVKRGDTIDYRITAPDGKSFAKDTFRAEKAQIRRFGLVGKKIGKRKEWPTGTYLGTITINRVGREKIQRVYELNVQ